MITYNHEKFIEQALISAVNQETSFKYEIVIGEDCSTDRTGEIIRQIQGKYPDKIRLLPREKNLGPYRNALDTQKNCTGSYIAFLEGDDYWIDKKKLQKQVESLDKHPDYVLCFSNVFEFYEDGSKRKPIIEGPKELKSYYTLFDILEENFIPTCTVVYRNGLIDNYPEWFTKLDQSDWSTDILLSKHGRFGFIEEVMAARRIHSSGVWSGVSHEIHIKSSIKSLQTFDKHFNYQYHDLIQKIILGHEFKLAVENECRGNLRESLSIIFSNFTQLLLNRYVNKFEFMKLLVKYCFPMSVKKVFRKK